MFSLKSTSIFLYRIILVTFIDCLYAVDLQEWGTVLTIPEFYFKTSTPNHLRCEKLCERQGKCVAVTFDKLNGLCYMHENAHTSIPPESFERTTKGPYLFKMRNGISTSPVCDRDTQILLPSASQAKGACHDIKGQWQYIFGARNGTGKFVYETWKNRSYICTDPHCLIYKNEVVRKWRDLNIVKVRVALYVGSNKVAWVEFNGVNSDALNWFSENRLTGSSWKDILRESHNKFSIDDSLPYRRFYISHIWNGCPGDKQWMVVSENDTSIHCGWDKHRYYPQFQFAKGREVAGVNNMGLAEWFKIFIQEK